MKSKGKTGKINALSNVPDSYGRVKDEKSEISMHMYDLFVSDMRS